MFHSPEFLGPAPLWEEVLYATRLPGWTEGIEGPLRPVTGAADPWVVALAALALLLVGLNMGGVSRLLRQARTDLVSVRRRDNAFDVRGGRPLGAVIASLGACCLCLALLTALSLGHCGAVVVAELTVLAAGWYIFQGGAYATVGYVFADPEGAVAWRRGFTTSQALLGVTLVLPSLVALLCPEALGVMLAVAVALWFCARIVLIYKGFRIFYTGFPSLLYFILYLCTLEIVPLVAVSVMAARICI